ncbi:MAG: NADPH-dependent oxidoreductase [Chloroflexi bacterium]|nr:NADPH-dependent oxidoreductase [Chloroflexota bacterium]
MTIPTIDLIHKHGSVRKYKPDLVPQEMVETIVAAGQRASTSSNLQMFSVIAVSDSEKRIRLQELCGGQKHIGQAPIFLAWCTDLNRLDRICKLQGFEQETGYIENFLLATVDAAIASQNSALAAESLGLGICYIGGLRTHPRQVMDLLQTPHLVFPLVGMTLGWPLYPPRIRPRLPLNAVLHWENYSQDDQVNLYEYDQKMMASGIYKGREVSGVQENQKKYGWMEHSARRVSQAYRIELREVLEEIGYLLK